MIVNLNQPVEALDSDGTAIKNKENAVPSLKELILFALRSAHQKDTGETQADCKKRAMLIKRIVGADEIELTADEVKVASDRVHLFYLQVELKSRLWEILEGK